MFSTRVSQFRFETASCMGPNRVFGKTEDYGFSNTKKVNTGGTQFFWQSEEMKTEENYQVIEMRV
mgnify:CR=1 FL=1